jgi:hypothetical protein
MRSAHRPQVARLEGRLGAEREKQGRLEQEVTGLMQGLADF